MTLKQITGHGKQLALYLALFADCFERRVAWALLRVYVQDQLSGLHHLAAQRLTTKINAKWRCSTI